MALSQGLFGCGLPSRHSGHHGVSTPSFLAASLVHFYCLPVQARLMGNA